MQMGRHWKLGLSPPQRARCSTWPDVPHVQHIFALSPFWTGHVNCWGEGVWEKQWGFAHLGKEQICLGFREIRAHEESLASPGTFQTIACSSEPCVPPLATLIGLGEKNWNEMHQWDDLARHSKQGCWETERWQAEPWGHGGLGVVADLWGHVRARERRYADRSRRIEQTHSKTGRDKELDRLGFPESWIFPWNLTSYNQWDLINIMGLEQPLQKPISTEDP